MPVELNIRLLGDSVFNRLESLGRSIFSSDLMERIGFFISFKIKERTAEGVDVNGTPFKPYSEKYKMFREKTGHPTNIVNLFYTGSMLGSMTPEVTEDSVRVYFLNTSDSRNVKNPMKALWLNESRNFFALSQEDIQDILGIIRDYYRELIR